MKRMEELTTILRSAYTVEIDLENGEIREILKRNRELLGQERLFVSGADSVILRTPLGHTVGYKKCGDQASVTDDGRLVRRLYYRTSCK